MTKILIADDDRHIRELLVDTLVDAGYEVLEAEDGGAALELAVHEQPDLILLDVWMPTMDGFEVLRRLRSMRSRNPGAAAIPVILLTAMSATQGEQAAINLGASHYITKPWEHGTVETAVRVALREVGKEGAPDRGIEDEDSGDAPHDPDAAGVIRIGNAQMDQKLGGGIPLGSLTLLDGIPSSGKSVLCQYFAYDSLRRGRNVAYYTSEYTAKGLIDQMGSFGLDISTYVRASKLGIYPLDDPTLTGDPGSPVDPGRLMAQLTTDIQHLPSQFYRVVIVDDLTNLASVTGETVLMSAFASFKRLCDRGSTIILTGRPYAFDEKVLNRLQVMCDAHISLVADKVGAKLVKMLEVRKLRNAELRVGNTINFDIESGEGLRIVPGAKVKV